jgi:hypothetical protein
MQSRVMKLSQSKWRGKEKILYPLMMEKNLEIFEASFVPYAHEVSTKLLSTILNSQQSTKIVMRYDSRARLYGKMWQTCAYFLEKGGIHLNGKWRKSSAILGERE